MSLSGTAKTLLVPSLSPAALSSLLSSSLSTINHLLFIRTFLSRLYAGERLGQLGRQTTHPPTHPPTLLLPFYRGCGVGKD